MGDFSDDFALFLDFFRVRFRDLDLNFILTLRHDCHFVGTGSVQSFIDGQASLFHGLGGERLRFAVDDVGLNLEREGDAAVDIDAVPNAGGHQGKKGEGGDANDEEGAGVPLHFVIIGTQIPEEEP